MKRMILGMLAVLALAALSARAAVTVSNVSAAQVEGTKTVRITYDVAADTPTVTVSLVVSNGAAAVACPSVTGAVGPGVATGTGRSMVWNAGTDWDGNVSANLRAYVTADDGVDESGRPTGGDPSATSWEEVNERWVKNTYADGAVTMSDRTTRLVWLYDASMLGTADWEGAKNACNNLTYAGHSDWFLPDIDQLHAMYSQKSLFGNVQDGWYWSITPGYPNGPGVRCVVMSDGDVRYPPTWYVLWVWSCMTAPLSWTDTRTAPSAEFVGDTRDYILAVASAHGGNPVPGIGTHAYAWRATVTASVDAVAGGYICTGWIGTGSIPVSGNTRTTGVIVLNEVASSITWSFGPANTWYVATNGNDSAVGTSWGTAKRTIQAAIDVSVDSDTIVVANGTYTPITTANRKILIESVNGADVTFIDGGGNARCSHLGEGIYTLLRGFTLQHGYADCGGGSYGGTLVDCKISGNRVVWLQGGAYGEGGGAFGGVLINCTISGNSANTGGGGEARSLEQLYHYRKFSQQRRWRVWRSSDQLRHFRQCGRLLRGRSAFFSTLRLHHLQQYSDGSVLCGWRRG